MPTIVWIIGGVVVLAVLKAASEVRVERAATLSELVATAQAAATSEALLLQREQRQKERDAAREAEKNSRDDAKEVSRLMREKEKEARQDKQYADWERYRTARAPLIFEINGREVCARVEDVRVRGVVLQDGAEEHCFQAFEALQWIEGSMDDLDNPELWITPPPKPLPPPDTEEEEDETFNA